MLQYQILVLSLTSYILLNKTASIATIGVISIGEIAKLLVASGYRVTTNVTG
jgi:hypothetical protein